MSLNASRGRLAALTKNLVGRWYDTKDKWKDRKADEFEQKYINDLTDNVTSALAVIEKLDETLTKIRKDCG